MNVRTGRSILSGIITLSVILAIRWVSDDAFNVASAMTGAVAVGVGTFFLAPKDERGPPF